MTKEILILDPTLRDGSHVLYHQITEKHLSLYAEAVEAARVPILEIGHGLGIGASSLQIGKSLLSDALMIRTVIGKLKNTKLCVFVIPGIATINKDLKPALDLGVEVFRIASHCTEADLTQKHIEYIAGAGKIAYGSLMMSHMASKEVLLEECRKMEDYGAKGVTLMDSAGASLPDVVREKIGYLSSRLSIPVGFHAHNNLGLAIMNTIVAIESGATIIDGTSRGFGAGTGNAQLEVLVPVLEKMGYKTGIDLYKILDAAELAEKEFINDMPKIDTLGLVMGITGICGAFTKHIERIAKEYDIDARDICFELGKRKTVAGQEDLIVEVARKVAAQTANEK
ncbi:MAG: 4-hydroxy-2-oxovalerate aldolase [Candidatus Omnitrophica bacterium]|nr:4-hydroxy-2-oxovalerate aldolase [Candidatus Omnitrophota bacterium]